MATTQPATIPELLAATVLRVPDEPALGAITDGAVVWQTWAEINAKVERFARALVHHNVKPGSAVVQVSANCEEWIVADLAILSIGAVHVPLHVSLPAERLVEQIADCEAKLLLLSGEALTKLANHLDSAPPILCYDKTIAADLRSAGPRRGSNLAARASLRKIESLKEFEAADDSALRTPHSALPDDLATLLYTSGTTGRPRGVMLSHRNLVSNAIATTEAVGDGPRETRLTFLPLSHIYARTCDLYAWLYRGTRLVFNQSRETIFEDFQLVQPTVLNGVPYFFQKVVQQIAAGKARSLSELLGGNLTHCFSGGAAVPPEVERQFEAWGQPLLSGYGLTEASPVVTASSLENYRAGTVGRPLADVEVRLADHGEILVRGPNLMKGYLRDEAATRVAIVDGWLHTGDLGEFDPSGNLRIVGRQKEIFVLSTGKNVSPTRVEQLLSGSPWIESVCVVGDGRKCLGALIVPNPDALRKKIREKHLWVWSSHRAVTHPRVREVYRREIDRLLTTASREEQVGPFTILSRAFSVDRGETTAKLSLCRKVLETNFSRQIEAMYKG